jgi:Fe2+ or Zn2+ uptake regulation protein
MVSRDLELDDLIAQLRGSGERVTTARRAVLDALIRDGDEHPSADRLARQVNKQHPDVHLSTIYRTLDFLEQIGMIVQVRVGDEPASYHFADQPHHHAICDRCGATIELPSTVFAPIVRRLSREHGFEARPHHIAIGGRCSECRQS